MSLAYVFLAILLMPSRVIEIRVAATDVSKMFLDSPDDSDKGTKWAVLVAGSKDFGNYRHQADVCHAYQIMRRGGLKDENIIVFMYDDIANHPENPTPGIIINKPDGPDVYQGVPKDYTGNATTKENLYAVLLGNKKQLKGGSGKVLNSGPDYRVFFYYADHGAPGLLSMPVGEDVLARELNHVFKKMHSSRKYKSMVVYVEACESGSIFDGLLPENIGIYATTASNPHESSFGYYCDSSQYNTCLGDLYSIAWMEDVDKGDTSKETLREQYQVVKTRTILSHVMQYGDKMMEKHYLSMYFGKPQAVPFISSDFNQRREVENQSFLSQRDAELFYFHRKVEKAPIGSTERAAAQQRLNDELTRRRKADTTMEMLVNSFYRGFGLLFSSVLSREQTSGQPVVDDWDCLEAMVRTYERHCGRMSTYGKKYLRVLANMCNNGITIEQMEEVLIGACGVKSD
ncbi:hypothetical protein MLD38_037902 [Melastoma candidum]|uniref:Uncharacterized protein n=1 Tax=Melastoma candidum TaxID=119954 RepID=A0ACB9KY92_9MYRT|nr:hypothetical protein MLD38_037902 [Melastoma candidum]